MVFANPVTVDYLRKDDRPMKSVISIGNQEFISIRKNNCFYMDKTDFIREWWDNQDSVISVQRGVHGSLSVFP